MPASLVCAAFTLTESTTMCTTGSMLVSWWFCASGLRSVSRSLAYECLAQAYGVIMTSIARMKSASLHAQPA